MSFSMVTTAVAMGIGATMLLDLWAQALNRAFGIPTPNWALVGRWFAYLPRGRFLHDDIARTEPLRQELAVGWAMHYAVGILFALVTVALGGAGWVARPTLLLPLAVGLVTVGCGWFILQPGMGAGIAAAKRPDRSRIRLLNVLGHIVFGLGLYGVALLLR